MPFLRRRPVAVLVSLAALSGAGGGAGVALLAGSGGDGGTVTVTQAGPSASGGTAASVGESTVAAALSPAEVYRRAKGSVVFIRATLAQGEATGSGFVVSSDGFIVTNAHVVSGARSVSVAVGDGRRQGARVVGVDESTDLALLDVDASGLTPLALGDSDEVAVGDGSYAIGNPFGLDRTLTTGVISALDRQISSPNGFSIAGVIQTDAALNPGNSGGPLLNTAGEVIGVNSQIETDGTSEANAGVGFAVPSNTVRRVVEQLRTSGRATHAYLGVATAEAASGGVAVGEVKAGGPADAAGLRTGDVIRKIGSTAVEDTGDVSAAVDARDPGQTVPVTVTRGGRSVTVEVKLGTRPS